MEKLPKHAQQEITILVVDDDEDICNNLVKYLANNGYSTSKAYNGQEGLELLKQYRHNIALVDLKLPDISGIDLLKSIKSKSPNTLIILISGYATIEAAAEAIKHGAYDFIAKPFNFDELERTLHRAIEKKTQIENLNRLKKRNIIMALTLPLWVLLGYIFVSFF